MRWICVCWTTGIWTCRQRTRNSPPQIVRLLGEHADRYGIAVLDLSDPDQPRYAEHRGDYRQNVGSVGKLVVALGLFQALADAWPDDLDNARRYCRTRWLRRTISPITDHHKMRLFDVENAKLDTPHDAGR